MTSSRSKSRQTNVRRQVNARRSIVYGALLDPGAVATWMVPAGMTSKVHSFEPWEGGYFRVSLTYDEPTGTGKTTAHTDTYHGRFVKLVENEQVVEVVEFETSNPDLQGDMTLTISLADRGNGTEVVAVHDRLPPGLSLSDNEAGWQEALGNLALFCESGGSRFN